MSAVPTPYVPATDFTTEAEQPITVAGLPGPELDAEFANIATSVNGIRSRLTEIQRDDGELANEIVTPSSLSTEALALITAGAYRVRGFWTANESYNTGDIYGNEDITYLVLSDYQSGATFGETDTDATTILGQPRSAGDITLDFFEGDGEETVFTLSKEPLGANNIEVMINGLVQMPGIAYNYSGTTLTFTEAPPAPEGELAEAMLPNIWVRIGVTAEVQTTSLPNASVTEDKLTTNSVSTAKIQDDAVTTAKILDSAITTAKIADGAVTEVKLATNSISSSKLQNGSVTSGTLATDAITTAKIQNQAVTSAKLANEAVVSDAIAASAVTTAKVNNAAITTAKINDGAVTTAKLADDSVTAAKIADGAVEASAINSSLPVAKVLLNAAGTSSPFVGTYARSGSTVTVTHNDYINATYSQSGTTITITKTGHGLLVNQRYVFDFQSGTAVDGEFPVASVIDANTFTITAAGSLTTSGDVRYTHIRAGHIIYFDTSSGAATDGTFSIATVPTADTFTFTHGSSGTTSGVCSLNRASINKSTNVASVSKTGTGIYHVNFSINLSDSLCSITGWARAAGGTPNAILTCTSTGLKSTKSLEVYTATGGGTAIDSPEFTVIIYP